MLRLLSNGHGERRAKRVRSSVKFGAARLPVGEPSAINRAATTAEPVNREARTHVCGSAHPIRR
jgi:hypothetical protein